MCLIHVIYIGTTQGFNYLGTAYPQNDALAIRVADWDHTDDG
ncbi:MAG: hypothetical protein R3B47_06865 [Bacteroidia bacterium]